MDSKIICGEHGAVCSMPEEFFGYFGWPSVAADGDGNLYVVASGLRETHICPFGRTVLCVSRNGGRSWASPRVINDSPLDDRDAGIISLGGKRLLLTWFTSDIRRYQGWLDNHTKDFSAKQRELWDAGMDRITDDAQAKFEGSWLRLSDDGGESWQAPIKAPVNAPHGPILLRDQSILYFGKEWSTAEGQQHGKFVAMRSRDDGRSWVRLGEVPLLADTRRDMYHEAHLAELHDGRLVGMIRFHADATQLSILQTESADGGVTWSSPRPLGFHGSPPHLIRHSSGVLVLTYGYRKEPFGQRVAFSRDHGRTWDHDWILRDDGPDADLGYPATVELPDGSLVTVYYQKPAKPSDRCALLYSRWSLPRR